MTKDGDSISDIKTIDEITSINWEIVSPMGSKDTVGSASNPVYMYNGTITACTYTFSTSTTDLTAGASTLATNEIRFIYE